MIKRSLLATGTVAALALTACGGGDNGGNGGGDVEGGVAPELQIAYNVQPPSLDPLTTTAHATRIISRVFYEPLLTLDADGEVQPVLAESYDVSEDGLTITFDLRDDVVFHDGSEVTEEDVVASLERWQELSTVGPTYFGDAEIESPEAGVVTITMPEPMFVAPTLIADPAQPPMIMPASVIESAGPDGVDEHIGTGPYEFGEWQADQHIRLDRFEDYTSPEGEASGMAGEKTAHFEELYFAFVQDASTRVSGIQTGEYDLGIPVPWDNAEAVENDPSTEIVLGESGLIFGVFNKDPESLMADASMRQAVVAAMEPADSLQAAYGSDEYYNANSALMPEGNPWYVEPDSEFEQMHQNANVDQAEDLLEEAGYDGEEIRIITTRDYEDMYNNAVVLQQQLQDAGMNVDLIVSDWPTVTQNREDPEAYEIFITDISAWPSVPATFHFFNPSWPGWTDSDEIADAAEAMIAAADEDEAVAAMEGLQEAYFEYLPIAKFGDRFTPAGLSTDYTGYEYVTGVGEIFHHVRPAE